MSRKAMFVIVCLFLIILGMQIVQFGVLNNIVDRLTSDDLVIATCSDPLRGVINNEDND